jgi:Ftsk gamma domain
MSEPTAPPRPPFRLDGRADLKHLNVRKEGPDDEKILAVDVKLAFEKVDRSICGYFDDALADFLWRHETSGLIVRNAFLKPVAFLHEISSATVTIDGNRFHGCEVKRPEISPRDGGTVDVTVSVSIYPSSSEVADLAKRVQDGVLVSIEGPPDLFDSAPGDTQQAAGRLQQMLREDGVSAELVGADGAVLAKFGGAPGAGPATDDPMIEDARVLVLKERRASISLVQRHLRIGYNRAARLLESLEALGVVSAMGPNGARSILGSAP